MANEAVNPRSHAERERIESRELSPERLLDRLQEMAHASIGRAPRVDAEPGLLLENGLDAPEIGRVRRRVHEALQADVLVRPQRPARIVLPVELELIEEDLVPHGVAPRN